MPHHDDNLCIYISDDEDKILPKPTESKQFDSSFEVLNSHSQLCPDDLIDPCPDVHALFQEYNRRHFGNKITHTYVEYSRRMTSCAGTCTFMRTGCRIALSEPLLKLRPVSDLKSTLLHEMIHAFLFLTKGLSRDGPDGHGPMFLSHAHRINQTERGVQITPYHNFHAEVDVYRVHHWRCSKCARLIKRAMNRAPAPTDVWWSSHQRTCGGKFIKIAGPPPKEKKSRRASKFGAIGVDKFDRKKINDGVIRTMRIDHLMGRKHKRGDSASEIVPCPVCDAQVDEKLLSKHLESCIPPELLSTQADTGSNLTKDRNNRPPLAKDEDARRSSGATKPNKRSVSETIEIPESPIREATKPKNLPSLRLQPNSKRPRSTTNALKDDVIDVDALTAIAVEPCARSFAEVDRAVASGPIIIDESETPNTVPDIRVLLRPILETEKPIDLEQKAILKLKAHFGDYESRRPFSFYEAAKMLKMEQTKLLESVRKNATITRDGDLLITREARELLNLPPSKGDEREAQRGHIQEGKCPAPTMAFEPEVYSRQRSSLITRRCPLCDQPIGAALFDEHLRKCLEDSNIPSVFMDRESEGEKKSAHDMHPRPMTRKESKSITTFISREHGNGATLPVNQDPQRMLNCPVCDIGVLRSKLESHVASCLKSTGLLDAL
eukprot:TRINITY_DN299_c0_g1_i15.p1 TRINITY_DN299_c0_g1~~TRINITY_DN299_c0_g1_i15.p1  ORF type:complete len:664 (+),score=60.97 TRINITY_DN299_c0_g1_i15:2691-4682(+)